MSIGAGTLTVASGFGNGTNKSARSNGKQHTLPDNPHHERTNPEDIEAYWDIPKPGAKGKGPTRLWGTVKPTKYGGVERVDGVSTQWLAGEYWNVDSNIRRWGLHEVRRNAAAASHDVHRHDQITRIVLPPQPGSDKPPRQCVSGVVTADSCFLEAWGFDLGLRDRQANYAPLFKPVTSGEQFRSQRSYSRNCGRLAENYRMMRKTASVPGQVMASTLRPEDIAGEAGEESSADDTMLLKAGRTFGSRSCSGWDRYDHTVRREAAKTSCGTYSPSFNLHPQGHVFKDELELNPASVYTKKYIKNMDESAFRGHYPKASMPRARR
ncbi:unnamed protein product [Polarella glacialis]|uniref:Uncharacterized protein n=1 Tax=Polarella glacialis TaxID=89957 RepID=A0A813JB63_POLGL|nr:unnamed protein product [Polarella glacialis]